MPGSQADTAAAAPPAGRAAWAYGASLLASLALGLVALRRAYASPFVIQDDARQHVWWMLRWVDPGLFPGDRLADYFQAVAPPGYQAIYGGLFALGLDPLTANKLLPIALGLAAAHFTYRLAFALYPSAATAFLASLMHGVRLWCQDDLLSATSRAFFHPLFVAFLYFLVTGARVPCVLAVGLLGAIYPQGAILACAILAARLAWMHRLRPPHAELAFVAAAGGLALAAMLPFAATTAAYGPIVSLDAARTMPEWQRLFTWHRSAAEAWHFFVAGDETGLLPLKRYFSLVPFAAFALLVPAVRRRLPALARLAPEAATLGQAAAVSLALFVAAHATLFYLYLPSRYTQHSLWLVGFVGGAIAVHAAVAGIRRRALALGLGALALAAAIAPLWTGPLVGGSYVNGAAPGLYAELAAQPRTALVASISDEADNLPAFARRSVLFSCETYNAFHLGFSRPARERALAIVAAQYAPGPEPLRALVRDYGVTHFLLDRDAFTFDYLADNRSLTSLNVDRRPLRDALRRSTGRPWLEQHRPGVAYEDAALILLDVRTP